MKIILLNKFFIPYKILSLYETAWNNYTYGPLKLNHYSELFIEDDELEKRILFYTNSPYAVKMYFNVIFQKFRLKKLLFIRTENSLLQQSLILEDKIDGNI